MLAPFWRWAASYETQSSDGVSVCSGTAQAAQAAAAVQAAADVALQFAGWAAGSTQVRFSLNFLQEHCHISRCNGRVRKHDPRGCADEHYNNTSSPHCQCGEKKLRLSLFSHTELHQCSKDDSGFTATAYCCVLQLGVVAVAARGALTAAQDVAAAIVSGNAPSAAANAANATRMSAEAASAAVLAQGGNADDAYAARAATAALIAAQAAATAAAAAGALGLHLL